MINPKRQFLSLLVAVLLLALSTESRGISDEPAHPVSVPQPADAFDYQRALEFIHEVRDEAKELVLRLGIQASNHD